MTASHILDHRPNRIFRLDVSFQISGAVPCNNSRSLVKALDSRVQPINCIQGPKQTSQTQSWLQHHHHSLPLPVPEYPLNLCFCAFTRKISPWILIRQKEACLGLRTIMPPPANMNQSSSTSTQRSTLAPTNKSSTSIPPRSHPPMPFPSAFSSSARKLPLANRKKSHPH